MGKLAIQMSKKHDLKSPSGFDAAKVEIETYYDDKIANETVPPTLQVDLDNPALDQSQTGKTSLKYKAKHNIDQDFGMQLERSFRSHPQIAGRVNAEIVVIGKNIEITVDTSGFNKSTIKRVLEESLAPTNTRWQMEHQRMVQQRLNSLKAECTQELKDLAMLRDNS
ncbi:MAG: hypothetical protein AB7N80_01145 [Bdellovibrionales bacterium]